MTQVNERSYRARVSSCGFDSALARAARGHAAALYSHAGEIRLRQIRVSDRAPSKRADSVAPRERDPVPPGGL